MSEEPVAAGAGDDWIDRLYARSGLSPSAVGALMALAILLFFASLAWATGLIEEALAAGVRPGVRDIRLGITFTALAAYGPSAARALKLRTGRHLAELREASGEPVPGIAAADWRRGRTRSSLLPVAALPALALAIDRDPGLYLLPDYWSAATLWTWTTGSLSLFGSGRLAHTTWASSRGLTREAERLDRIDPLDRRWLAPFARHGILCAWLWLAIPALFMLNFTDEPVLVLGLGLGVLCVAAGAAALLLPTAGARRRLLEAQQRELGCVHRALRGEPDALRESTVSAWSGRASLADLLAYQRALEAVPRLPFGQGGWLRFALAVALPLGSWLGGAAVERLVAALLD